MVLPCLSVPERCKLLSIKRQFWNHGDFYKTINQLEILQWQAPVKDTYPLHLLGRDDGSQLNVKMIFEIFDAEWDQADRQDYCNNNEWLVFNWTQYLPSHKQNTEPTQSSHPTWQGYIKIFKSMEISKSLKQGREG